MTDSFELPTKQIPMLDYPKYFNWKRGLHTNERSIIIGKFKEEGSDVIIEEEFSCLNYKDDAETSYKATIDYFNYTLTKFEKKRTFVSAVWKPKEVQK